MRNKSITDDYLEDPKTHQTFGITYDRLEFEFGYLNIIDLAGEEGFRNTWTSVIFSLFWIGIIFSNIANFLLNISY